MRYHYLLLTMGLLLLGACNTATPVTPSPPAAAVEIAVEPTAAATDVPSDTAEPVATEMPATTTPLPEPATATAIPTSAGSEVSATVANTTSLPATEETRAATAETTATPSVTEEASPTLEADSDAEEEPAPTAAPLPPGGGGNVPQVSDTNYPAFGDKAGWESRIQVPAGFEVTYVGRVGTESNLRHPTSITFGPDGLLYIATQEGVIHTMDDAGVVGTYVSGFTAPTGIAFRPGTNDLYVSDRPNSASIGGEGQVSIVGRGTLIGGLPCCYGQFHSAQGITFGPDGKGYVGVGARADHGEILDGSGLQDELHPLEASILRFDPDTGAVEVYAYGLRNPYDHAWDGNGQMWVTDNMPDFDPPEKLHRIVPGAQHGYPWYDCGGCFPAPPDVTIIPPAVTFPSSSSPTGITAYLADQFPGYRNSLFVTLWTSLPFAQKVVHVGAGGTAPQNFATGLAAPIDLTVGSDGSLYVADWASGIIFRISYTG